jgi:ATP-binding cassette subfamily F protein 3
MISLQNVSYNIAGRVLLKETSLTLPAKHRFGLVGRNGSGKTTLLRMLLKEISPTDGKVEYPKDTRIVSVSQETPGGEESLLDFVIASDGERNHLMSQLETESDPQKLGDIYERLIDIDAFSAEARAAKILRGLGFSSEDQKKTLNTFSGGFRKRVALATALFQDADLLLLDEPTNHLDFESVTWLMGFLADYPKTLILISHDQKLLNHVAQSIIHLHGHKLTTYKGNYDQFTETFALQRMTQEAYNKKVAAKRAHWQSFVDRFRAKATKARQAQSRMKALAKLSSVVLPEDDPTIHFSFPEAHPLPSPFLTYNRTHLGYPHAETATSHMVLKNISGRLGQDDRIALLGANGNGKSTFAKFIAGTLLPLEGKVTRLPKLRVGYFHQHQMESLDPQKTALENLGEHTNESNITALRTHLGNFGLSTTKATTLVKDLSGGEKARLAFSLMCLEAPHLIILDEPTNHLDIEMRASLEEAINQFSGAVIIISHDWSFLESTVDQLWVVGGQTIRPFEGTIEDYSRQCPGNT